MKLYIIKSKLYLIQLLFITSYIYNNDVRYFNILMYFLNN